jgi:hypothetical protein
VGWTHKSNQESLFNSKWGTMKIKKLYLMSLLLLFVFSSGLEAQETNEIGLTSGADQVTKAREQLPPPTSFDSMYGRYIPGKGYVIQSGNVGLQLFREQLDAQTTELLKLKPKSLGTSIFDGSALNNQDQHEIVLSVARSIILKETDVAKKRTLIKDNNKLNHQGEMMFMAVPTPSAVSMAMIGVELMLDDLLNRANSTISSALFSLRSHIAASESDLNGGKAMGSGLESLIKWSGNQVIKS